MHSAFFHFFGSVLATLSRRSHHRTWQTLAKLSRVLGVEWLANDNGHKEKPLAGTFGPPPGVARLLADCCHFPDEPTLRRRRLVSGHWVAWNRRGRGACRNHQTKASRCSSVGFVRNLQPTSARPPWRHCMRASMCGARNHARGGELDRLRQDRTRRVSASFELYKDKAGEFRFRFKDGEGNLLASSGKGYEKKADCQKVIDLIKREASKARIDDQAK
jgi:uncharacterized protein YegP (UPF0339 family)